MLASLILVTKFKRSSNIIKSRIHHGYHVTVCMPVCKSNHGLIYSYSSQIMLNGVSKSVTKHLCILIREYLLLFGSLQMLFSSFKKGDKSQTSNYSLETSAFEELGSEFINFASNCVINTLRLIVYLTGLSICI